MRPRLLALLLEHLLIVSHSDSTLNRMGTIWARKLPIRLTTCGNVKLVVFAKLPVGIVTRSEIKLLTNGLPRRTWKKKALWSIKISIERSWDESIKIHDNLLFLMTSYHSMIRYIICIASSLNSFTTVKHRFNAHSCLSYGKHSSGEMLDDELCDMKRDHTAFGFHPFAGTIEPF